MADITGEQQREAPATPDDLQDLGLANTLVEAALKNLSNFNFQFYREKLQERP